MKKINPKNSIMLIISFLIIYSVTSNSSVSNILATNSSNHISEQLSSKDLVEISPIVIANDDVFESYGFPGDGSEENPYRVLTSPPWGPIYPRLFSDPEIAYSSGDKS